MMTHAGASAVAGIGVDLLRLDRIERVFARHGERFVRRILGPQEIEKFNSRYRRDPQRGLRFLLPPFPPQQPFPRPLALACTAPMPCPPSQRLTKPVAGPTVPFSNPFPTGTPHEFGPG